MPNGKPASYSELSENNFKTYLECVSREFYIILQFLQAVVRGL